MWPRRPAPWVERERLAPPWYPNVKHLFTSKIPQASWTFDRRWLAGRNELLVRSTLPQCVGDCILDPRMTRSRLPPSSLEA